MNGQRMPNAIIAQIIAPQKQTFAEPQAFFVAWSGVLTLAYTGYTPPLARIKQEIGRIRGIAPENDGAKWPKTTLGAVRDGERIDRAQLLALHDLCSQFNPKVKRDSWRLPVDKLQAVLFGCRSLEKRLVVHETPLAQPASRARPRNAQLRKIEDTLAPFKRRNLANYWTNVARDGNRCSHYRDPHIEATLVCFLPNIPLYIDQFKTAVDSHKNLRGLYCWFGDSSLHMTVRGLS